MCSNSMLPFLKSFSRFLEWLKKPKDVGNILNGNKDRLDSSIQFHEGKYQTLTASDYFVHTSSIAKDCSDLLLLIPDNGIQSRMKFSDNNYILRSLKKGILIAKEKGVCLLVSKNENIETCYLHCEGEWELVKEEYIVLTGAAVKLSLDYDYERWNVKAITLHSSDNHGIVIANYIDMLYDKNNIFIINEILINENGTWKEPTVNVVPKNKLNTAIEKMFESCDTFATTMLLSVYDLLTRRRRPLLNVCDLQRFNKEWENIWEVLYHEIVENDNLLM